MAWKIFFLRFKKIETNQTIFCCTVFAHLQRKRIQKTFRTEFALQNVVKNVFKEKKILQTRIQIQLESLQIQLQSLQKMLRFYFFIFFLFRSNFAAPTLQPVMVGSIRQISQNPLIMDFQGSITVVLSNGKYILFDTGSIGKKNEKISYFLINLVNR